MKQRTFMSPDPIRSVVTTPELTACGISDPGKLRARNEDSIYLEPQGRFFVLADGMGGHERGAEASSTVVKMLSERLAPERVAKEMGEATIAVGVPPELAGLYCLVEQAVDKANAEVYSRNLKAKLQKYMGTTVVGLCLFRPEWLLWFHVGDSRLYRFRDKKLSCLTVDHSMHALWIINGKKGPEPMKQAITRAIGPHEDILPEINWDKRVPGDLYLLCSDGLSDMVSDPAMEEIFRAGSPVEGIAAALVDEAKRAGGRDNISVILLRV
ncbi:MAG: protein phosphatase 2C domain-containing protein [Thermodesulfobacteriota bacterium]